ncbi:Myg1 protein [Saccharomycopsis crataegensis]|uniref:Myg1 protein n=1 Tax=Saccharomycopsis crataegensis TaxID=43959 RepID=A0AAV5QIL5_9ASCO|nr:Myg1 protein [Saccharomycopsis crataegensis]
MSDQKRQKTNPTEKMSSPLKICVHSGSFHADEALGYYLLKLLPRFKDATLIRSRDQAQWEASDIVIDVSGKYDGVKFFDHHQRGFEETFSDDYSTKLSSAGLVYKHFGREIISEVLKLNSADENVDLLYLKMYKEFVESLDANDNGIEAYPKEVKPAFHYRNITLPSIVANFNPSWNEDHSDEVYYRQFLVASDFIGNCFLRMLKSLGNSWLPAKKVVSDAFVKRFDVDKSGRILILDQFAPWKEHLYDIEFKNDAKGEITYVLFEDTSGSWRISTVPITSSSFSNRRPLPEKWRGVRDQALSDLTGVEGCVFVHAAGFIGGAKTKDAVLKLARMSLTMD